MDILRRPPIVRDMSTHQTTNIRCCRTATASYRSGWGAGHEYIVLYPRTVPDHDTDPHSHHYAIGFIDGNAARIAQ
jgi:hypothetical protein